MAAKKKTKPITDTVKMTFTLHAPDAQSVKLAGNFSSWEHEAKPMRRLKNGSWKATLSLEPKTYEYRFLVDGQWVDDPECDARKPNPFGGENCVCVVA